MSIEARMRELSIEERMIQIQDLCLTLFQMIKDTETTEHHKKYLRETVSQIHTVAGYVREDA